MSTNDTTISDEQPSEPDPDVRAYIDIDLTDEQADHVAALIWQYHDKRGYSLDHLRSDLVDYGAGLTEADAEAIIDSDCVDEAEEHRYRVDIPWYGEIAAEIAEAAGDEHGATEHVTYLGAHREDGGELKADITDHHGLLDRVGDLLAEHRPDEVPDRETFTVLLVDITVEGDGFAVIEEVGP